MAAAYTRESVGGRERKEGRAKGKGGSRRPVTANGWRHMGALAVCLTRVVFTTKQQTPQGGRGRGG